ncbi:MAG TPA: hypothetical protein P5243_07880 [Bacteroidales bacterium]|nr:hypothetical protein [Bacteroidales bacterium]HRS19408.1 hypothetical protein [Bacteroidales bacterium]
MKSQHIFIFILLSLCISCGTTECPPFPDELQGYVPYQLHQKIQFYNENNDTVTLLVTEASVSSPSSFKNNCDCECYTIKKIKTNKDSKFNINCNIEFSVFSETNNNIMLYFYINTNYGYFTKNTIQYSKSILPLGDTIHIEKYSGTDFSNMKIVYNKGLIQFYDTRNTCLWKLVE